MNYKTIRKEASDACKLYSGTLALIFLIYALIANVFSIQFETDDQTISFLTASLAGASLFVAGPMTYGLINVIIINYKSIRKPLVSDLFSGFKYFWKLFVLNILISIYTFLWSLLFIIPGIIKGISYSRAFYIFYENPELSAKECIDRSKQMMEGYKWDYFALMFSYIGWIILCILTLGILSLWVSPKNKTASYIFYNLIKNEKVMEITDLENI